MDRKYGGFVVYTHLIAVEHEAETWSDAICLSFPILSVSSVASWKNTGEHVDHDVTVRSIVSMLK